MKLLLIQEGWGPGAAGWQQCECGRWHAAATGLVCSGVEVATVIAGSGIGHQAATVVAAGRRGCNGEGAACVHTREVGVTLM